jgi:lipopolysaccharide export system protein LptA
VWTPKRILLLALTVTLFFAGYLCYGRYLGGVDGLPPLPQAYWRPANPNGRVKPGVRSPKGPAALVRKLEEAFGKDCPEIRHTIKIEVQSRGLILIAENFEFVEGRVKLVTPSVAIYGKARGEDGTPEINTVRGKVAYLTFERPIQTLADMGKYRIIAGQIAGNVRIVNNRRTLNRDDDICLDVVKGPLYYNQATQKIWTDDFVRLVDGPGRPEHNDISGQGMEIDLVSETPQGPGQARVRRQQFDHITGVNRIQIKSAVDMRLYVDARSGFLNSGKPDQAPPTGGDRVHPSGGKAGRTGTQAVTPAQKAQLIIKTPGPFDYDLRREFARFDVPPPRPGQAMRLPECVNVVRVHKEPGQQGRKLDQIDCEHLELQFRKKAPTGIAAEAPKARGKADNDRSLSLQIETARATGQDVVLTSDTENMDAHGNNFFYDARSLRTTLKGTPMWAAKDGNVIEAPELQIQNTHDGQGQTAVALGEGKLSLYDKSKKPVHAHWKEKLVSSREGEFDVIHLMGNASFIDEENHQDLKADDLKVWLEAPPRKSGARDPKKVEAGAEQPKGASSRRPHHLVATGHVVAASKEFNIHKAQGFEVWFKDVLPSATLKAPASTSGNAQKPSGQPGTPAPAAGAPAKKADATAQSPQPQPRRPIDLEARTVEAHVLRVGEQTQLEQLRSVGEIHVTQASAKPGEKGLDIRGERLELTARPEGHFLVVRGATGGESEENDLAQLGTDKMVILGPEVHVNQGTNEAWVVGMGAMTLESDQDFQGNKLKQPVPLNIHWDKSMYFNGTFAEFRGDIEAEQGKARLACQELQVFFDRPISLKEGARDGQKARIRNLVCDRSVRVEDSAEGRYQQVRGTAVTYDNEEGRVWTSGPGEVRILDRAAAPTATPGKAAGKTKQPEGRKLTHVSFFQRMYANKKTNLAIFYMNVRALHMPCEDEEVARRGIDLDKVLGRGLPQGAMFLRCDRLEVLSRAKEKGKTYQEMKAEGRVSVQSDDFSGQAERVVYEEEKEQVIFDGGEGGVAVLYKASKIPNGPPQRIEGKKIFYNRRTGEHWGVQIKSIIGQ